jgi:hypothetical protein
MPRRPPPRSLRESPIKDEIVPANVKVLLIVGAGTTEKLRRRYPDADAASSTARAKTASIIGTVSFPVKVFC